MKKQKFNRAKADESLLASKRDYFLGSVSLHDISKKIATDDQKVYYVKFKNGARTKLHYHEGSQVLVVTGGSGVLVLYKKKSTSGRKITIRQYDKVLLRTGDIVYIPKNTLHWHGASGGRNFNHVAINGFSSRGKEARTVWYETDF